MQKFHLPFCILRILLIFCVVMPNISRSQSTQPLDELRQQFSTSDQRDNYWKRQEIYWKLMDMGEPGYRVICDLFIDGKFSAHDWTNWDYDYATRGDAPNAGISLENYIYNTSAKDKEFLSKMAKAYAKSDFPDLRFVEILQGESKGAILLGYMVLRIRYADIPKFAPDSSKAERDDQLATISKFLATKPKK